jgi:mono/diheme cytochrome c family protein
MCGWARKQQSDTTIIPPTIMIKKLLLTPLFLGFAVMAVHADEAAGKAAYMLCAACHNPDGTGLPIGDKKMAPSLVGSKVVTGDASVLALVVLKGIKKEGTEHIGIMAPLEAAFAEDQKLADVLTYVRSAFGNKAAAVSVEDAAKFRAKWKDEKVPVTRAKLAELSKPAK